VTQSEGRTPPESDRLSAEEVGARVGAILAAAENEAREVIASARRDAATDSVPSAATIDELTRAGERLNERFDAFELALGAQLADLARTVRAAGPGEAPPQARRTSVAREPEDSQADTAARVRAIDLALAGNSREAIANELAVSMSRGDIETLLDQVLVS
jgi:hypothetical protein